MTFPFKTIKSTMSVQEASEQYGQLLKLALDESGCYSEENSLDCLRVAEALGSGRMPTRGEMRERVRQNELAHVGETIEQARDRYAATLTNAADKV